MAQHVAHAQIVDFVLGALGPSRSAAAASAAARSGENAGRGISSECGVGQFGEPPAGRNAGGWRQIPPPRDRLQLHLPVAACRFERGRRHCAAPVLAVTVSSLRWSFSDRRRPQSGFSTTNARYALRRITPSRARAVVLARNQEVDARQSLRFCNARQWNNDCDADVVEQSAVAGLRTRAVKSRSGCYS